MICWINPFTGLAGDMLLGALVDAGAPLDAVRDAIAATGLTGWELTFQRVTSHALSAGRVRVAVADPAAERSAADLIAMAQAAPGPVADFAVRALTAIAEAEAALHDADPGAIHLHELGGHDTLIDIVGTGAALHALGVTTVHCAPLPLGGGQVSTRHGILPCPAPATLRLLAGASVTGTSLTGETVTPTAAALLRAAAARYDPPPAMTLARTGYGAGTRELPDRPNVVSVTLGTAAPAAGAASGPAAGAGSTPVAEALELLETNLDDVTGETLGYVIARALAAGALDAWVSPAVMKKGRPAHILHVLTRPADTAAMRQLVFAETGTLGIRCSAVDRTALPRHSMTIDLYGMPVRVKQGPNGAKPEHDDLASVASSLGLPLRAVGERAARVLAGQDEQADQAGEGDQGDAS